jgi:uncharacterized lipoprotein YddW (UPF0748 family)
MALLAVPFSGLAGASTEIILDNGGASFVGSWSLGTASPDKYGIDYRYTVVSTSGGRSAVYTPPIPYTSSDWEVYVWYPQGNNRTTEAQYFIKYAGGYDTVYLNQQMNGGRWYYLGMYPMSAGMSCYVQITNYGSDPSKVVMADGVKFYSASGSGNDLVPPIISDVTASPAYDHATIRWRTDEVATAQVEYGLTPAYGSQTTQDAALTANHCVQLSDLAPGTTYHYRAESEDCFGNQSWSQDLTFATDSAPPSGCFRGNWLTGWGDGFQTEEKVSSVIDALDEYNYNALVFEARKNGDAAYNSSYEYKDPNISPQSFDPLADMIAKAHAKDIEVHAWIVAYRIANSTEANAPPIYWEHKDDWLCKDSAGNTLGYGFYNLDPGIPGVQDYVCKIVKDIVSRYDIDGISLDYIRYYSDIWGYNDITRERFRQEYGYYPPTSGSGLGSHIWNEYRRQQVTDLVKKCQLEIQAINPRVKLSICGQTGGIWNYESSGAYTQYFQDWRQWMRDHIIDVSMPMNYRTESDPAEAQAYRDCCDWSADNRYGRHTYTIQACSKNTIADTITQLQYSLGSCVGGLNTYQYWATNSEGASNEEFYSAIRSALFPSKAAVPDMPWKSAPTTGIIFGTVTDATQPNDPIYKDWVYKATVQVTGPVTRSTTTDGTGTYGFIDLPPGTYAVTCSKSGFTTRTYTTQTILAGDVLRDDFDICPSGQVSISSPSSTIYQAGKSLFSLPYDPVDPDPAVVMAGIPIDGLLVQWHRATQSSRAYDEWDPDFFGNLSLDQGYWLTVDSPRTITYQAYPGYAGSAEQSLPKTGWNIIGCPFATEHLWADMRITNGTTTVSLEQARDNGWINSVGIWWDSVNQSSRDVGLPDDWCYTDYLQPWHGHWLKTYVYNLTLTQR